MRSEPGGSGRRGEWEREEYCAGLGAWEELTQASVQRRSQAAGFGVCDPPCDSLSLPLRPQTHVQAKHKWRYSSRAVWDKSCHLPPLQPPRLSYRAILESRHCQCGQKWGPLALPCTTSQVVFPTALSLFKAEDQPSQFQGLGSRPTGHS